MAGVPGLEPRLTESESAVLPLDDTPTMFENIHCFKTKINKKNGLLKKEAVKLFNVLF